MAESLLIETNNQYITASLEDVVAALVEPLTADMQGQLQQLAGQMATYYNLRFRAKSDSLKSLYRHFNPSTPEGRPYLAMEQRASLKGRFFEQMQALLVAANYQSLSLEEVQAAIEEQALFDLRVTVNLADYDKLLVFRRGGAHKCMRIKRWFGRFGERQLDFINYDRVALIFAGNRPGSDIHIKLFQNVPRHDIEILLPEPQVRMRLRDKLIIGVPAVVGGVTVIMTKLGPTLLLTGSMIAFWLGLKDRPVVLDQGVLIALGVGLAALAGHFWRQFGALKNRRLGFLKTLTENLYFKSLDNNSGAIQQLLDTAADEEVKECFLAYSFLVLADMLLAADELDQQIEAWLRQTLGTEANFDVSDAAHKVVTLGLAVERNGKYIPLAPAEALEKLNQALRALVFPV